VSVLCGGGAAVPGWQSGSSDNGCTRYASAASALVGAVRREAPHLLIDMGSRGRTLHDVRCAQEPRTHTSPAWR
jgi:hypothetical protein